MAPAEYQLTPGGRRGRHQVPFPCTGMTQNGLPFPSEATGAFMGASMGTLLGRGAPALAPPPLLLLVPGPTTQRGGQNQYRIFLGREGILTRGVVDMEVGLRV